MSAEQAMKGLYSQFPLQQQAGIFIVIFLTKYLKNPSVQKPQFNLVPCFYTNWDT
jgi:hypothetical protein